MSQIIYLSCAAFILTVVLTKLAIKKFTSRGLVSEDFHKQGKPKKPISGGIAIAGAFTILMLAMYFINQSITTLILLLAFLTSAAIGLFDDIYGFPPKSKFFIVSCAAIPLLWLVPWELKPMLLLFLLVAVASNWTNMLAGFNGLEMGTGMIAILFLAASSNNPASAILYIYTACLFAFLLFNKYPATIFPGDIGTLPIGTMMVAAYLIGAPLLSLGILLIPYAFDAGLKFLSTGIMDRKQHQPTGIENGKLIPRGKYVSLIKIVMWLGFRKEWQVVAVIWGIEIGLGIVTLLI
jgi:UDP-N-acetylglucosamine--dolichyl-phosphate N-acetylglucosaminephosphotransferase